MGGNSSRVGAADVISRIQKQNAACPDQKFAVAGYSQGGMVMRSALSDVSKISERAFKQIVGGAMFGAGQPTGIGKSSTGTTSVSMGPWRTGGFAGGLEEKIMNRCAKGDFV
jgi:Cutinase